MWKKDQIKLLLPRKRYTCFDTIIVTAYNLTIVITVIIGIQLLITAIGIRFRTFLDLRLFEPYVSTDSNLLLCVSLFVILSSSLGILSAVQRSYMGIITSIGLLVLLLGFIDVYALSNYRIENYLSLGATYQVLLDTIMNNPFENIEFHLIQKRLACCGINDYTDWLYTVNFIPGSCCDNSTLICDLDDPTLNKNGCLQIVHTILSNIYQNTTSVIKILNIIGVAAIFTGYFYSYLLRELKKGDKILRTAIPRVQMSYNTTRGQQTGTISNLHNNRSSAQVISNIPTPTAPTSIYPNLYSPDSASNI